jgi:hypothetical protein
MKDMHTHIHKVTTHNVAKLSELMSELADNYIDRTTQILVKSNIRDQVERADEDLFQWIADADYVDNI